MSARYPDALTQVVALLHADGPEPLCFRAGIEASLERVLDGLARLSIDEAVRALSAILGLELVLRGDRRSQSAADALDRVLRSHPTALEVLIEIERRRLATPAQSRALVEGGEATPRAPQQGSGAPGGTSKVMRLGNAGIDHERLRAQRGRGSAAPTRARS